MPYVMVPVPEEHVEEVMQFMLRAMGRANLGEWEPETVAEVFAELDEFGRTLLAYLSRHAVADKDLPEKDAAALMQLSVRETLAVVREVNEVCRDHSRPAIITRREMIEVLPNGRTQDVPVITMEREIADIIVDVEKADREANPQSLSSPD